MTDAITLADVRVGPQGRLVVPAPLRRAMDIREGDVLVARVENGSLILDKRDTILARLRERFRQLPRQGSVVDELIQERRAEARRDSTP